ncbi:MAG TPA: glycosyl hydrolase [Chryseolinea sp.]|nr:glycosyl hydrolase [Chryseolinea sp.]
MIIRLIPLVVLLSFSARFSCAQGNPSTTKPWTYWWWMGGAVDSVNVQRQLLAFSTAGFGGVHIIPIYGVKGYESKFKPFLGNGWMSMLSFTTAQAYELGLGVDLTMGTGWPFGGKHVTNEDAAKKFVIREKQFIAEPTGQQVKRAAPGGEGLVIDYYDSTAVANYFKPFEKLQTIEHPVRSLYHDSYEAYGANWSTHFSDEFIHRRGYALASNVDAFTDSTSSSGSAVRMDYQQTLSELLRDRFTLLWTQWAKSHGYLTRDQAHGSPANILDLYALADIPETESFGTSRFRIPGLRVDDHYEVDRFGTPDPLAMKFASSAANLTGKKLVSSETATWLADHFKVSLSQVKPQIDELFTAGINHVFYHGITYSPEEAGFPGWLFYASTNFGPQSHVWKHISHLNGWVMRCQQLLQNSAPDNDILLYFPMHDLWSKTHTGTNPVQLLDVHHSEKWLRNSPFGKVATQLTDAGLTFDYVSDSLLSQLVVKEGRLLSHGQPYRMIVVPPVAYMPITTIRQLNTLSKAGVAVIYVDHLPKGPSGLHASANTFSSEVKVASSVGRHVKGSTLVQHAERMGARREGFAAIGLRFIRKRTKEGVSYFVANLSDQFTEGWVRVSENSPGFRLFDPLSNTHRDLLRRKQGTGSEIYLELRPGESAFIQPVSATLSISKPQDWSSILLKGSWTFAFEEGRPAIKVSKRMDELTSWTSVSDSAQFFYGAGRYQIAFNVSPQVLNSKEVILDLGDVREVADVWLNGQSLGTAWSIPFQLRIPAGLLKEKNSLEVVVSNLSANYMRLYDRVHPEWKKFYDINIVDIQYKPYSAANAVVMPSGLVGDVRILHR